MRTRLFAGLAVMAVIALTIAPVALALTTSTGKLSSSKYKAATKSGRLTVLVKGKARAFHVSSSTVCGYSRGESGGALPGGCKSLGKSKYHGSTITVRWKQSHGVRFASLASVHLTK
jgi:hypothetical protein